MITKGTPRTAGPSDYSGPPSGGDWPLCPGGELFSQFLSRKIPNEIEDNFATAKDGRSRYLDFRVTGSVFLPQSDLFDRIIGDKAKLLKKILGIDRAEKRNE